MTEKTLTFNFEARDHASEIFRSLHGGLGELGKAAVLATGAIAIAAVGVGVESVKAATKFQSAMELIRTQAGSSQAEVAKMSAAVLALAPKVGTGPDELAAGLYHIESAGIRGAHALDILKVAAEGAKVGHADLETVTNALVAAQMSGVQGVNSMTGAMGTLNAIVGAGNMRMGDLTAAFTTGILSAAKTFGVSLQSVGAAMADMTNQGIPAIDAATRITSAMRLMAAPTHKAATELQSIGIAHSELANAMRGPGGITAAVADLRQHLDASGLSATQQAALLATAFGGKQSLGILTLVGNMKAPKAAQKAVAAGAGAFGSAWEATHQTAQERIDALKASLDVLAIQIGTALLPVAEKVVATISDVVTKIQQWVGANQPLIGQIGTDISNAMNFIGDVLFGHVVPAIQAVIGAVSDWVRANQPLITAVENVIGAFGKVIGSLMNGGKDLGGALQGYGNALAGFWSTALDALGKFAGQVLTWIGAQVPGVVSALEGWAQSFLAWIGPMIPPALAELGRLVSQVVDWVKAQIPGLVKTIEGWANAFIDWIGPIATQALGKLGDLVGQLFKWVSDQLPGWAGQLLKWADQFLAWIGPAIPPLLGELGKLGGQVIDWIVKQIPVVAVALGRLAIQLVAWVLPKIPDLLVALAQVGVALIGWIADQVVKVGAAFVQMAQTFVQWVIDSIPSLLDNLGQWFKQVEDWVGSIGPKVFDAFAGFGKQIVDGIMSVVGNIGKTVGDALNSIPGVSIVGGVLSFAVNAVTTVGGAAVAGGQAGMQIGAQISGGRAAGGPVAAGAAYVVGEKGPELFVPSTSGMVVPNGGITAMGTDSQQTLGLVGQANQKFGELDAIKNHIQAIKDHVFAIRDHIFHLHDHTFAMHEHLTGLRDHITTMREHVTAMRDHLAALVLHKDKLAAHAERLAIHTAQLALHAKELTLHSLQMAIHSAQLAPHAAQLAIHTLQLQLHDLANQKLMASQDAHSLKMTAHAAEMVDHKAAMAAHKAAMGTHSTALGTHSAALGKGTYTAGALNVFVVNGGAAFAGAAAAGAGSAGGSAVGNFIVPGSPTILSGPDAGYLTGGSSTGGFPVSHNTINVANITVPQGTTQQQAQSLLYALQREMTANGYGTLVPR